MLLRQFLLLVMLMSTGTGDIMDSVPLCDSSMVCFSPSTCMDLMDTGNAMEKIKKKVTPSCEAIVKIRSYTANHILIVLESYNSNVGWITLKQDSAEFTCRRKTGDDVIAIYNGKEQELTRKTSTPLSLEFFVKQDSEIFLKTVGDEVLLSYEKGQHPQYEMDETVFKGYTKPTCDPDNAEIGITTDPAKLRIFTKIDIDIADLTCPEGYKFMFREKKKPKFVEASKMMCEKDNSNYRFVPQFNSPPSSPISFDSKFDAHCEATICEFCETNMTPSNIKYLSIKTEPDGCKKLECDGGRRIKIGDSQAKDGSAQCDYEENRKKSAWKFNDETIIKNAVISLKYMRLVSYYESHNWLVKSCTGAILELGRISFMLALLVLISPVCFVARPFLFKDHRDKKKNDTRHGRSHVKRAAAGSDHIPSSLNSLQTDYKKMLDTAADSGDVSLKCDDGEIRAHSLILKSRTSVEYGERKVAVLDCSVLIAKLWLLYVYTSEVAWSSLDENMIMWEIASNYGPSELIKRCADFSKKHRECQREERKLPEPGASSCSLVKIEVIQLSSDSESEKNEVLPPPAKKARLSMADLAVAVPGGMNKISDSDESASPNTSCESLGSGMKLTKAGKEREYELLPTLDSKCIEDGCEEILSNPPSMLQHVYDIHSKGTLRRLKLSAVCSNCNRVCGSYTPVREHYLECKSQFTYVARVGRARKRKN